MYVAPFGSRKNKKKEIIIIIIIIVTIVKTFCAAKVIRIFVVLAVYYYYYYYYYLSPLCRVFTILHPKQTVFVEVYNFADVLYLQCVRYKLCYFLRRMFCPLGISNFPSTCAVPNVVVSVVPQFHALPVCCSGIFRMILKWLQSPLLLLVYLF